ncbi:MAG: intracellular septation protein [Burkholderiales bacterium]|jgi:intracellular septation protein
MKFLFDLFPIILFFGVFKWGEGHHEAAQALMQQYLSGVISGSGAGAEQAPIMLATAVAIVATIGQVLYQLATKRKVDTMLWISFAIITVFGGATIYFHNETFIKWKPTVLYWAFGAAILISQVILGKNLIRLMMEKQISLPDTIWQRLSLAWAAFFSALGLLNLYVAYNFSTATWATFKVFGATAIMFAFIIAQSLFLSKYVKDSR